MMERLNFARHGMTKLPPGFRFQPTDEELVFQYLKCKVLSLPLPASIIPEINICQHDPWDLPGDLEEEKYFFSNKEPKYASGNRINRSTASGYWKATGVDRKIVSSSRNNISNNLVGMKKTLVFHRGKPPHDSRTDWVMHEYRLVTTGTITDKSVQNFLNQVLCRVFLKKRSDENDERNQNCKDNKVTVANRLFEYISSTESSSSSSCSGITEVSSSGEEGEVSSNDCLLSLLWQ